ncbi:MAG: type 1 glutamine amidotransferase [Nocardioides sp.]
MTRVVVVEHESGCPPAYVGTWLAEAGAEIEVCRPWAGDELPAASAYDALVVLGGSMGANDDHLHHWIGPVKQLVRNSVADGTPVLGICLGHQLVAAALGGTVERDPLGQQVGLYDVGWLPEAEQDELVGALGPVRGIQWNHDLVTSLPEDAIALAQTPQGELQVARFAPRAWGVQLHPEADEHILVAWAEGDREEHLDRGVDQEMLLGEIADARAELDAAWRPLVTRFVDLAT